MEEDRNGKLYSMLLGKPNFSFEKITSGNCNLIERLSAEVHNESQVWIALWKLVEIMA